MMRLGDIVISMYEMNNAHYSYSYLDYDFITTIMLADK